MRWCTGDELLFPSPATAIITDFVNCVNEYHGLQIIAGRDMTGMIDATPQIHGLQSVNARLCIRTRVYHDYVYYVQMNIHV